MSCPLQKLCPTQASQFPMVPGSEMVAHHRRDAHAYTADCKAQARTPRRNQQNLIFDFLFPPVFLENKHFPPHDKTPRRNDMHQRFPYSNCTKKLEGTTQTSPGKISRFPQRPMTAPSTTKFLPAIGPLPARSSALSLFAMASSMPCPVYFA